MKWTVTASLWLLTVVLSAWGTSANAQTSDDWTNLFSYLQTECAEDSAEVNEACAWLTAVDACSAGDTLACDSIWAQWSTFVTDSIGSEDNGNDITDFSDSTSTDIDDAIDTILGELQAECDADTTGSAVECDLIPLAAACLGGDSLACLDWASAWMAYEDSLNDETEVNDDSDGDDTMDGDDAFENDSLDDHSDDWANILADLQNDCAQDTTGLDASCGLASTLEACLSGDSLACLEWESAWAAMGDDDHAYGGDEDEDEDEDEEGEEEGEDDDDEEEGDDDEGGEDDDDEWEDYGGSMESILSYLQADCAEDTTGLGESCTLAAIAASCLAGDSLACVEWNAAWLAYANDEDSEDNEDEDDESDDSDDDGEDDSEDDGEDDGEDHDSDDDGLSDDDEVLYSTDANSPDTDGDGLSDGDEVLLFNLSPTSADTDGNGIPDPVDLVYSMLPQVNACPSDINRDGTVSIADMLLFLVDFGTACPQ